MVDQRCGVIPHRAGLRRTASAVQIPGRLCTVCRVSHRVDAKNLQYEGSAVRTIPGDMETYVVGTGGTRPGVAEVPSADAKTRVISDSLPAIVWDSTSCGTSCPHDPALEVYDN